MTPEQIAQANAELSNKSALDSMNPFSLAPGFSRVGCAVNEWNGFNRFPRATAVKPLKRRGHRPRLFTGLKPGANEMSRGSSLPLASQKRHREPEQTKRLCK